jgi:carbon monoxide dehydrogenase subunit G
MLLVTLTMAAGPVAAAALDQVLLGDVPNTDGKWQSGEVTVAAPPEEVQRWFSDVSRWTERFPDDEMARDLGRAPDGRRVAELRSKALGKTLTVRMRERPGLIEYDGSGKGVETEGRIYFYPAGPGRTRIVMQTTGELHGLTGLVATEDMKRDRALKKLGSDLEAAVRLSKQSQR